MADILCPNCNMPNPDDQNICSFCRQPLRIAPNDSSIKPGDMPTKKTTAELEPILPQWLRDARAQARETSADESEVQPTAPQATAAKQPESNDWLAGLDAASRGEDKDEVPDWLSSLAPSKPAQPEPKNKDDAFSRRQEIHWEVEPVDEPIGKTQSEDGIPFWMKNLDEESAEEKQDSSAWTPTPPSAPSQPTPSPFEAGTFRPGTGELRSWLGPSSPVPPTPEPASQPDQPTGSAPSDWMANFGSDRSAEPPASDATSFDWLKEESSKPFVPFQRSQMEEESPLDNFGADLDLPDWMKSAGAEEAAPSAPSWTPPPSTTPEPAIEETPDFDWLKSDTPAAPAPQTDADLPDWMKSAGASSAPAPQADAGAPDWLSSLGEPSTPATPQAETDTPDWMSSLGAPSASAPQADTGAPDWLSSLGEPSAPAASQADADMPDWISSLGAPSASAPQADAGAPDWLSGFGEPSAPATPQVTANNPDWMSSLGEPSAPAASQADADLPDWMNNLGAPSASVPQADAGAPDWLSGFGEPSAPAASQADAGMPDWMSAQPSAPAPQESSRAFDWAKETQPPAEPAQPASAPAFISGDESLSMGEASELFSGDMPDWLSNISPSEQKTIVPASSAEPEEEFPSDEDISPADLPTWVQAMRPVETAMPISATSASASQPAENVGPLAGLRGVLPAAPGYGPSARPKAYSLRLQPSQDQLELAAMLETMLATELEPQPFRAAPVVLSQRILRWAVAGILMIVILGLLIANLQFLPAPSLSAEGNFAKNVVDALPVNAPVLLIFDYEPALAGEMEAVASSYIEQLISLHRPQLTVLSTSPTGAALAERFLKASETRKGYIATDGAYTNLGYLPGESAGIASFVANPGATLRPVKDVAKFSDYTLVILLTDRAETARAWVEQTTGHRDGSSFVIISSAQSAPMIQPYLLSGQVNGLVTGLNDGAALDQIAFTAGRASQYWNAYNLSLLAACAMIVIGGLWNLWQGIRSRRHGLEED